MASFVFSGWYQDQGSEKINRLCPPCGNQNRQQAHCTKPAGYGDTQTTKTQQACEFFSWLPLSLNMNDTNPPHPAFHGLVAEKRRWPDFYAEVRAYQLLRYMMDGCIGAWFPRLTQNHREREDPSYLAGRFLSLCTRALVEGSEPIPLLYRVPCIPASVLVAA